MDFRILGPIEVVSEHGSVRLGGPQRQLLLAVLLSHAGEICSAGMLSEALWDGDPPAAATAVLHSQLSRLRRSIEPDRAARAPGRLLRSIGEGYLLDLAGHTLDAHRFAALADEGRELLGAGRDAHAVEVFTSALALWRGPAFGDLGGNTLLQAEAAALEEQRTTVYEWWADAQLRCGEHAALVGQLEPLVREHPYRERLWNAYILALYRSGRQVEALAVFQRCRSLFVDELGIEPSGELQALNQAILLQAPELDWRPASLGATSTDETGRDIPAASRQRPLPALRNSFVGRSKEVSELTEALRLHRLVTVTGAGGVGKTRLALEVAATVGDDFRHGVAFCDLVAVNDPRQVEPLLADAIGAQEPPEGDPDYLARHLAGRDLLLVVDNADHVVETVADLTDRLLAASARVRMLVTSRGSLGASGERLLRLGPLSVEWDTEEGTQDATPVPAAVRLFLDRAAMVTPVADLDPDAVGGLCRRLDGLPLAVELAASRLRSIPLLHLIAGLDNRLSTLAGVPLPRGATPHGTLHDVIDWSVDLLTDDQQALLRRLAVFGGGCTAEAAAYVCDIRDQPVERLAELVDRSLVQLEHRDGSARYRLLETIRAHGLARLAEHGDMQACRDRHLAWCLGLAAGVDHPSDGEDPDRLDGLGAEIDNVVAALTWSLGAGEPGEPDSVEDGTRLAAVAAAWWVNAGRYQDARSWLERAVDSTAPTSTSHGLALWWLGWVLARQHDLGKARTALERAGTSLRYTGDVEVALDADLLLALVDIESGDLGGSEERLAAYDTADQAGGTPWRRATASFARGRHALMKGDQASAAAFLEQAADDARGAGMWHTLVRALNSLSQAESGRRRIPRAGGAIAEALDTARRRRLLDTMPALLGASGLLAYRSGDVEAARPRFEEALAAARTVGDLRAELATLNNLGVFVQNEGHAEEAAHFFEQALALADKIGDERYALVIRTNLAESIVTARHDVRRALQLMRETLVQAKGGGIRVAMALGVETVAIALLTRGEQGDAEKAGRLLGAAAAERETLERAHDADGGSPAEHAVEQVRTELGAEAAEACFAAGRAAGLDHVVDEVITSSD
jgi:predicted ATPase/DNA-binding SARP family transcriptional activator